MGEEHFTWHAAGKHMRERYIQRASTAGRITTLHTQNYVLHTSAAIREVLRTTTEYIHILSRVTRWV